MSFILSVDAYELAANPGSTFSCDVSAKVSCSTVASSWQATLLGFPNAFLGIAFGTAIVTVAATMLAGARLPGLFVLGTQAFLTGGLLFAWWMFQQAFMVIGVLCPLCLIVQAATTVAWVAFTRITVRDGTLPLPKRCRDPLIRFVTTGNDWLVLGIALVTFAAVVVAKYGSYFLP